MVRIGVINFRWNQWQYFATDKLRGLRFWWASNMDGFPRITDENHSSVGLVKKKLNGMLLK